jgi:hypothetical protein
MPNRSEIIAVLLADTETLARARDGEANVLTRSADGTLSPQAAAFGEFAIRSGSFRRGKPIIDPLSRQPIGYEMEMISSHALVGAAR